MSDVERTCDRIIVLHGGHVEQSGEVGQFTQETESVFIEVDGNRDALLAALARRGIAGRGRTGRRERVEEPRIGVRSRARRARRGRRTAAPHGAAPSRAHRAVREEIMTRQEPYSTSAISAITGKREGRDRAVMRRVQRRRAHRAGAWARTAREGPPVVLHRGAEHHRARDGARRRRRGTARRARNSGAGEPARRTRTTTGSPRWCCSCLPRSSGPSCSRRDKREGTHQPLSRAAAHVVGLSHRALVRVPRRPHRGRVAAAAHPVDGTGRRRSGARRVPRRRTGWTSRASSWRDSRWPRI